MVLFVTFFNDVRPLRPLRRSMLPLTLLHHVPPILTSHNIPNFCSINDAWLVSFPYRFLPYFPSLIFHFFIISRCYIRNAIRHMVRTLHGPIDCAYAVTAWKVNGTPTLDFYFIQKNSISQRAQIYYVAKPVPVLAPYSHDADVRSWQ